MASGIKIGNLDISDFKVGSADTKVYLGDTLLYPTTPPAFQGKWLATYQDSHTESAQCDSSSAIYNGEISLTDLVSVEIGDYCVTSIDMGAFWDCSSLTSIVIPNSVTTIGEEVFYGCTSLTSVDIPDSVTSIGNYAFNYCSGLTSIVCNATTPPTLDIEAFSNTNNCPIYVPSQSVNAYKSETNWSTYASRIQAIP